MSAPKVTFGRMEDDEMPIYVDGDEIGSISKQTAWNGERYVVSQYDVSLDVVDGAFDMEFPVKGLYAGQYGAWSQEGYPDARKALKAAKNHARGAIAEAAEREGFVSYLEQTLIPDLRESGADATADDFARCVELIRDNETDPEFVGFLTNTLIPDLEESGHEFTAEDFETCVRYLRES